MVSIFPLCLRGQQHYTVPDLLTSYAADSQCVLISSSRSSLCLQLSLSGATTRKISLSDVTRTQWPSDSICGLTTLPIAGPTRGPSRPNEETQAKRDGTTIAQVFTLARYLEVQHTICYMPGRSRGYNSSLSHQSGWRFVSRSHRPKSRQYVSKSDDEDFLVQDVDASSERSDKPSSSAFRSSSPGVRKLALEAAFSIPHDRAYQLITLPEAAVDVELTDALEALGNLEKTLSPVASGHVPITTL